MDSGNIYKTTAGEDFFTLETLTVIQCRNKAGEVVNITKGLPEVALGILMNCLPFPAIHFHISVETIVLTYASGFQPSSSHGTYYGSQGGGAASLSNEAQPHVIVERMDSTPVDDLRDVIVEISRDGVVSFFCGWQGCQYPVGFAKQAQLLAHIRSVHLQEKPYICTTCNATFDRRQDAGRHVATMNRRQYKCSGCDRVFLQKDHRDAHEDECLSGEGDMGE
ncbi:hypothetical protein BU17DRAFT_79777 [Hysterangium stoloniferum]|nr:hypothetical protein BU17DRAFT_79777 [Hysterangium stoloniferum]